MKKNIIKFLVVAGLSAGMASCTKDLNQSPQNDITADQVYSTPLGYTQAMAKIYGSLALSGNEGPAGNNDLQGVPDEGNYAGFLRTFWYLQELPTDEALIAWGDAGLQDFKNMNWSSSNPAIVGQYYRLMYEVTLANDFIRQSADDKVSSRGISGADAEKIRQFRSEARFLRAFAYWALMDLFGNPPFVTENDVLGASLPRQISRAELFTYVESELKAIEGELVDARANEYGRADKGAAWALLARLYLNAKVYTGTERYADAMVYASKVIDAGYTLHDNYRELLLADNNQQARNEFIFTINYDGLNTKGFGGMTFFTHASYGDPMPPANDLGVDSKWSGIRTAPELTNLFPDDGRTNYDDFPENFTDNTSAVDKRAQFWFQGMNPAIPALTTFTDGIGVLKYRNLNSDGSKGKDLGHSDADFPVFRLAEMYLIYAEAAVRTNTNIGTAVGYINLLRQRAYGNASGNVTSIDANFILQERARELYWEGVRRTDLIRYERFTSSNYLWAWKGGVKSGRETQSFRTLYPLPSADLTVNPNLKQNPGY
ncbi:RagB/SusD family nutrient uptake outer membrane protein [Mucilaginibacter limnophilus]|uniref:RagB/SusD family nutrient uptake outer membrane protein n=1 Tax=Mucilaginibacter limnophilus TaxID=1932778 RepID=A0A437MUK6_9SPHI|nr:RagB/SusD family nutrient uptake outer membrane protein [Mucilaginibacter limnophilus]RVU01359.1 RagB/SusD family nutrient uptake outer membrane protein [Mucilaginibacter limnophilus]